MSALFATRAELRQPRLAPASARPSRGLVSDQRGARRTIMETPDLQGRLLSDAAPDGLTRASAEHAARHWPSRSDGSDPTAPPQDPGR